MDVPTFFVRLAMSRDVLLSLRVRKSVVVVSVEAQAHESRRVCTALKAFDRSHVAIDPGEERGERANAQCASA